MQPKQSKWKIAFLTLGVVSLFAWGSLIWMIQIKPRQNHVLPNRTAHAPKTQKVTLTPSPTNPPSPTPTPITISTMSGEDGSILVYVPEGEFTMGSDDSYDKRPVHQVALSAFWIHQTEATNELFTSFVEATGYRTDAEKAGWSYVWDDMNWIPVSGASWRNPTGADSGISGREEHPVTHISWNDASAYCNWMGGRLPTEAEWEKAARGTDRRIYPWGNDPPDEHRLNAQDPARGTTEVGSLPDGASPYGAYDMAGNVWEWVIDWYRWDYYTLLGEQTALDPQGPPSGRGRILRGGSWLDHYDITRSASRSWSNPLFTFNSYGFRCVRPAP